MAITRVWVEEGCIGCGLAEAICPEVFKIEDNGVNLVIDSVDVRAFEEKIKEAAKDCPVEVIMYE